MTDRPLYIEPMIGWRTWHLATAQDPLSLAVGQFPQARIGWLRTAQPPKRGGDGQFRIVSGAETIWEPRERLVAHCRRHPEHEAPKASCGPPGCGIYAARSLEMLKEMGYAASPEDDYAPDVVGEVSMWGRVFVSDETLRAEFAYPKRLIVPWERWQQAKQLEEDYGVIVEVRDPFRMEA